MNKERYESSAKGAFFGWVGIIVVVIYLLLTSCYGTYYISDAEYSDLREEHAVTTFHNDQIYWGFYSGYYYYYGTPHYYPWYYYYNTCPPPHYNTTTHIIIKRPVNKPTHRPNRPSVTHIDGKPTTYTPNRNTKVTITPNRNTRVKTNTNYTRPKNNTKVKTNRNNTRPKVNNRKPK